MQYELSIGNAPSYKEIVRRDPCSYCFDSGGTVDHIIPRAFLRGSERGHWTNLTGACESCNRRKDKGKDGGHRSILLQLLSVKENKEREQRLSWSEWLYLGRPVSGPFFKEGVVYSQDPLVVYIPDKDQYWLCKNVLCLKPIYGIRTTPNQNQAQAA